MVRQKHHRHSILASIWQKYLPPRVSFFIWRLLHGYLATDEGLCQKGFHLASRCICGQETESNCHLFLECRRVQPIWRYFHQMFGLPHYSYRSPLALLTRWKRRFRSHHHIGFLLPCMTLWHIWKGRNSSRFDSKAFNSNAIIHLVTMDLRLSSFAFGFNSAQVRSMSNFCHATCLCILPPKARIPRVVAWHKPPNGVIKLNVDGCFKGNSGMSAAGGIFRDHSGHVLAAFGSFLGMFPIIYAELWAIYEGLRYAVLLGFSDLEVESDSTTIVSWIQSASNGSWDYIYLIARVRQILRSHTFTIQHILREANTAADFMANWAVFHRSSRFFHHNDTLPDGLPGIIRLDAIQFPMSDIDHHCDASLLCYNLVLVCSKPSSCSCVAPRFQSSSNCQLSIKPDQRLVSWPYLVRSLLGPVSFYWQL